MAAARGRTPTAGLTARAGREPLRCHDDVRAGRTRSRRDAPTTDSRRTLRTRSAPQTALDRVRARRCPQPSPIRSRPPPRDVAGRRPRCAAQAPAPRPRSARLRLVCQGPARGRPRQLRYAQFGPLSAYPRARRIRELYPRLPSAPLPAVITCIATGAERPATRIWRARWWQAVCDDLGGAWLRRRRDVPGPHAWSG